MAQEHAATAVSDAALAMLTVGEIAGDVGHVLVGCVEGEWHTMPARMVAEILRLRGWQVTFLGPSTPAGDLAAHVAWAEPDAVGLSCTVPLFLKGAQRGIAACRALGVPVLAGGAGFGPQGRYAVTLGADAWASDPQAAAGRLAEWLDEPPADRGKPTTDDGEHLVLEAARPALVDAALERLLSSAPAEAGPGLEIDPAALGEALDILAWAIENASLVGEPELVTACAPMVERAMPEAAAASTPVATLLDALLPELRRRSATAAELVERTLPALSRRPARP